MNCECAQFTLGAFEVASKENGENAFNELNGMAKFGLKQKRPQAFCHLLHNHSFILVRVSAANVRFVVYSFTNSVWSVNAFRSALDFRFEAIAFVVEFVCPMFD